MVFKFDETKLKKGDILLTTTSGKISKFVRWGTQSEVSHVMFYASDFSALDSTLEGVHARNTQRIFFDKRTYGYVLRLKAEVSEEKIAHIEYLIRSKVGTAYTVKEAILAPIGGAPKWSKRQFCSRLIAQAFHDCGVTIVANPNFCTPEDIKASSQLEIVNDAVIEVDAELEKTPDANKQMRESTNFILSKARKVNKNIQSFNDLYSYLVSHPTNDNLFNSWFIESGYLDVWRIDKSNNPWQYDIQAFDKFEMSQADKKKYCLWVRDDGAKGMAFYTTELSKTKVWLAHNPLATFRSLERLNENLIGLHYERVIVADIWLAKTEPS